MHFVVFCVWYVCEVQREMTSIQFDKLPHDPSPTRSYPPPGANPPSGDHPVDINILGWVGVVGYLHLGAGGCVSSIAPSSGRLSPPSKHHYRKACAALHQSSSEGYYHGLHAYTVGLGSAGFPCAAPHLPIRTTIPLGFSYPPMQYDIAQIIFYQGPALAPSMAPERERDVCMYVCVCM